MEFTTEETLDMFEEYFFHELESWFSSDIACCDSCYDDFVAAWPYAYSADGAEFQCNSIDLGCFYSGSRLSEFCTEEQFWEFLPHIKCPHCGESLRCNMWPYELPFTPPDNYEILIAEIAEVASRSPFLLLTHPFSQKVLDAIVSLSIEVPTEQFNMRLFRARTMATDYVAKLEDFDFPPKEYVRDGRYNHAGDSVLYLASTENVCKAEMRDFPSLHIASFDLTAKMKILDLMTPHEADHSFCDLLSFISFSALLSTRSQDHGFHKPEYIFSRFVKDCALHAGFDAIKYPSTRVGTARFNIVIINRNINLLRYAQNFSCTHHIASTEKGGI
jgi:hypothetical protein